MFKKLIALFAATVSTTVFAASLSVPMNITAEKGVGQTVGTVTITETKHGLLFTPDLQHITPGLHGLHIHENPSCENNGMAAGGHLDPKKTNHHLGPYNDNGHFGDLPALYVTPEGTATLPVLAPRIMHLSEIKNHALMIHEGGDNYSDEPQKLGGGGKRMICGIVK